MSIRRFRPLRVSTCIRSMLQSQALTHFVKSLFVTASSIQPKDTIGVLFVLQLGYPHS